MTINLRYCRAPAEYYLQSYRLVLVLVLAALLGTPAVDTYYNYMSKLHKYSTQPAAHSQDTNTGRSKGGRW